MSRQLNSKLIERYNNKTVAEHLASNYVLGLLTTKATKRVDSLLDSYQYAYLESRIQYWERKFSPLNESTSEIAPLPTTWDNIQKSLQIGAYQEGASPKNESVWKRFSWLSFSGAFSIVACAFLLFFTVTKQEQLGPVSYVAVLENNNKQPQVVATTYGNAQRLVLDIIDLPELSGEQSYELWVSSKTDQQVRSLGEIPFGKNSFDRDLTVAEWRLIKDSFQLLISIEDEGGSAIGEPSDIIVSRGLCIRLDKDEGQT